MYNSNIINYNDNIIKVNKSNIDLNMNVNIENKPPKPYSFSMNALNNPNSPLPNYNDISKLNSQYYMIATNKYDAKEAKYCYFNEETEQKQFNILADSPPENPEVFKHKVLEVLDKRLEGQQVDIKIRDELKQVLLENKNIIPT